MAWKAARKQQWQAGERWKLQEPRRRLKILSHLKVPSISPLPIKWIKKIIAADRNTIAAGLLKRASCSIHHLELWLFQFLFGVSRWGMGHVSCTSYNQRKAIEELVKHPEKMAMTLKSTILFTIRDGKEEKPFRHHWASLCLPLAG